MFDQEDSEMNEYRFVPARDPTDASKIIGLLRISGQFQKVSTIQFQELTIDTCNQSVLGDFNCSLVQCRKNFINLVSSKDLQNQRLIVDSFDHMPEVMHENKTDVFERELDRQKVSFQTVEGLKYEFSLGELNQKQLVKYTAAITTKLHGAQQDSKTTSIRHEIPITRQRDPESSEQSLILSKSAASRLSISNTKLNEKRKHGSKPFTKIVATVTSTENGGELYTVGQSKMEISAKDIAFIKKSDSVTAFIYMLAAVFPNGRLGLSVHRRPIDWDGKRGGDQKKRLRLMTADEDDTDEFPTVMLPYKNVFVAVVGRAVQPVVPIKFYRMAAAPVERYNSDFMLEHAMADNKFRKKITRLFANARNQTFFHEMKNFPTFEVRFEAVKKLLHLKELGSSLAKNLSIREHTVYEA